LSIEALKISRCGRIALEEALKDSSISSRSCIIGREAYRERTDPKVPESRLMISPTGVWEEEGLSSIFATRSWTDDVCVLSRVGFPKQNPAFVLAVEIIASSY